MLLATSAAPAAKLKTTQSLCEIATERRWFKPSKLTWPASLLGLDNALAAPSEQ
jgi:hypothetical protein